MNRATRTTVATMGAITGLAALEHGIGEVLQGSQAPADIVIKSWPNAPAFNILSGEPAMTLVSNLLVSGALSIFFACVFIGWALFFAQRKHGGLGLILLSLILLLVGGGFGPPLFGVILGVLATRINAPLTWWRERLSPGVRSGLAWLWPWSLAACVLVWLCMLPGVVLLSHFFGIENENLVYALVLGMFALLFVTIVAGFARDADPVANSRSQPSQIAV
jgi:hypothetical protein